MTKDLQIWKKRFAAMYGLGIWTMIGGYAFYRYTKKKTEAPAAASTEEIKDASSLEEKPPRKRGFSVEHTVVYTENFVPYSTRIYNFVTRMFSTNSMSTVGTVGTDKPEK